MCQKTQFFNFLKKDNSVMYTLHLLCGFISMVDEFKKFHAGQNLQIVVIFLESYP